MSEAVGALNLFIFVIALLTLTTPRVTPAPALERIEAEVELRKELSKDKKLEGGTITVDKSGRVEIYDRFSNRVGYGSISNDGRRIELYDVNGRRLGTGVLK